MWEWSAGGEWNQKLVLIEMIAAVSRVCFDGKKLHENFKTIWRKSEKYCKNSQIKCGKSFIEKRGEFPSVGWNEKKIQMYKRDRQRK